MGLFRGDPTYPCERSVARVEARPNLAWVKYLSNFTSAALCGLAGLLALSGDPGKAAADDGSCAAPADAVANDWVRKLRASVVYVYFQGRGGALDDDASGGVIVNLHGQQYLLVPLHAALRNGATHSAAHAKPLKKIRKVSFVYGAPESVKSSVVAQNMVVTFVRPELDQAYYSIGQPGSSTSALDLANGLPLSQTKVCFACWPDPTDSDLLMDSIAPTNWVDAPIPSSTQSLISWIPSARISGSSLVHRSGGVVLDANGRVLGITSYTRDGRFYAAETRGETINADEPDPTFLASPEHGVTFMSTTALVEAAIPDNACSDVVQLAYNTDQLLQAGRDYENRELVTTFPGEYTSYVEALDKALPATAKTAMDNQACGCSASLGTQVDVLRRSARLRRRLNALQEFHKMVLNTLVEPPERPTSHFGLFDSWESFCKTPQQWQAIDAFGRPLVWLSPFDQTFSCALGNARGFSSVTDLAVMMSEPVANTDICPAVTAWNDIAGTSTACDTVKKSWAQVVQNVAGTQTFVELGKDDWSAQLRLWREGVRVGLVPHSVSFVAKVAGVKEAALEQDAGLLVDAPAEVAAITKEVTPNTPTFDVVDKLNQSLGELPPEVRIAFSLPVGTDASGLFGSLVNALPDKPKARSPRSYWLSCQSAFNRLTKDVDAVVEAAASEVGNACATTFPSATPAPEPKAP